MNSTIAGGRRRTIGPEWPKFPRLPESLRVTEDGKTFDRDVQEMWNTFRGQLDRIGVDGREVTVNSGGAGRANGFGGQSGAGQRSASTGAGIRPRGPLDFHDGDAAGVSAEGGRFLTRLDGTRAFYQDVAPSEGKDGDLWFDQNDSFKPYIFKDGRWQSIFDDVPSLGAVVSPAFDARAILTEANIRANALLAERGAREAAIESLRVLIADGGVSAASQLDVLDASLGSAHARITHEQTVRAAADSALASDITTVQADLDLAEASIVTEAAARVAADGSLTASLSTEVSARIGGDNTLAASVTTEASARISADGSLGAEYVLSIATTAAGGFRRVTGFRNTNFGGAGGGTSFIIQTDKFAIVDTSGSELTSGTITVGKTYIISKAGGTFTAVGAANNNVNTLFVATGTTPTWGTGALINYTMPFKVTGGEVFIDKAVINEITAGSILAGTISVALNLTAATLNSPLITGSVLRFNGDCTICADTSDGADFGILRVNGGGANGPTRGGQIDLFGNEYTTVAGFNGAVMITPGDHADAFLQLNDRTATARIRITKDPAVDILGCNMRFFNGASQTARIDYITGFYYVQNNKVVGARGAKGAGGLTEIVALLDDWGAWA